jgi:hypothetical protein
MFFINTYGVRMKLARVRKILSGKVTFLIATGGEANFGSSEENIRLNCADSPSPIE